MKMICTSSDVVTMTGRGLVGEIRPEWAMAGWTWQESGELGEIDAPESMPAGSAVESETIIGLSVHLSRTFR